MNEHTLLNNVNVLVIHRSGEGSMRVGPRGEEAKGKPEYYEMCVQEDFEMSVQEYYNMKRGSLKGKG